MRPLTLKPAPLQRLAGFATVCAVGLTAAGPLDAKPPHAPAHHVPRHPARYAHRPMRLKMPTTVVLRRDPRPLAPAAFRPDRLPTAFTYQVARNGPEGSVGFHRPAMDPWGDGQGTSRGLASSLHLDRPESTFGASLSVPLR